MGGVSVGVVPAPVGGADGCVPWLLWPLAALPVAGAGVFVLVDPSAVWVTEGCFGLPDTAVLLPSEPPPQAARTSAASTAGEIDLQDTDMG